MRNGFTLIELSIVLVIIGLIVGGILVGRDLIRASEVRALISQIDKYNQAVNTFRGKYGYLPGDIPDPDASNFGFRARGTLPGQGNGDGILNGTDGTNARGFCVVSGENGMLWVDLAAAKLIEGNFPSTIYNATFVPNATTGVEKYLPRAKMGNNAFIYVFSGYSPGSFSYNPTGPDMYFTIAANTAGVTNNDWKFTASQSLSVMQAYNIDAKIDDGLPAKGKVVAAYYNYTINNFGVTFPTGTAANGINPGLNTATAASDTTCYDNGNVTSTNWVYSISYNNGANINCALSFHF